MNIKQYTPDELYALNKYLQLRPILTSRMERNQTVLVTKEFYMVRDMQGRDWMARKEGTSYRKMFCLESWKRFDWGNRQPRYIRQREIKNEKDHSIT